MDYKVIRPGGIELTRDAAEFCKFKKGDKILDVGCGNGAAADFLTREYGLLVKGIDIDPKCIDEAKRLYGKEDYSIGEAEMLSFTSKTFDGVFMECCLSLVPDAREAIHEAYCVLKNGGKLVISDLYWKNPTKEHKDAIEKAKQDRMKPHEFGGCQTEVRVSDCAAEGAFVMDEIYDTLGDLELEVTKFEDRSDDLAAFAASIVFEHGSLKEYIRANPTALCFDTACGFACGDKEKSSNLGYFLLVAEKR